ncbi:MULTISPECIES: glycoside hydrolase family 36 protein [Aliivibrio]|uniref:Glycosyl hydrolase n=1 Tax=Aliivibrio finisterrensis TaxID=511998 RepID=A0A4Q5KZ91_9GAMM|nr:MULTISPECIES: alpha-galactosidase [Aliivibrio]MDD9178080.1 alpha-galactosidase [Aliivibrio sp. A6]RYU53634.1 glycosyl hydrolase [Aliivibrio finisterrensis]RYU54298.1 glycosyl hydrolase [Aliivibrio finisterrensis]RYU59278.1 glycosyl hydrolase [Aliivibrio finisterrensis]RYU66079.1 glycosyl hydrolase [Aliivibrio finisterrensis]
MMNPLFFLCGQETIPVQTDLVYELQDDQVTMCFAGIHNLPINDHYLVLQFPTQLEHNAKILGDGFQMLSQTGGQVSSPQDIGRCPDNNASYRLYSEKAKKRFYNYLVIEQSDGFTLFGFTSCYRFAGYFEIHQHQGEMNVMAFLDGEHTHPQDWASNEMEAVTVIQADSLDEMYELYAAKVQQQHPIRAGVKQNAPVGWCSWYAYYADVTEQNVLDNLEVMSDEQAELEWVLLDDGYQAFMGDWLTPSNKFPNGIESLLAAIKSKGKKPAIWIAPFIAQPESEIFKNHPDWFVRHENGELLKAEDITYGGWRCTPWYILDTSKQAVQIHLTEVIRTMREEWGVELFKLDANYWGSLKGARVQSGITGIEAYRLGMQAIINGAGEALILGCNAPMWPSLGLVDAMRVSDDVERKAERFEQIAKETFYRSWQHRKLWQIDPDCITLVSLPNQGAERKDYEFHRNVILAAGGLALSGDPLPELNNFAKKTWKNLLSRHRLTQDSAQFKSLSNRHCTLRLNHQHELHCVFNYDDEPMEHTLVADQPSIWRDFWTGEQLNDEPAQMLLLTLESGLSSRAILVSI